jgi:hypothetical protein
VPHLAWPIRVAGTTYATCQQDTGEEAAAAVAVLCCFERGSRAEAPDFGITDPTFSQVPVDTDEIVRQAAVYEPRASLEVTVSEDGVGGQRVSVAVSIATEEA